MVSTVPRVTVEKRIFNAHFIVRAIGGRVITLALLASQPGVKSGGGKPTGSIALSASSISAIVKDSGHEGSEHDFLGAGENSEVR